MHKPTTCRTCGAPLGQPSKGRSRQFCGDACRQRWCRQRKQRKAEAVAQVNRASRNAA